MGLDAQQRQDTILHEVRTVGTVKVTDLARRFGVSTVTVRRDLAELENRRLVQRVHGGASLLPAAREASPVGRRLREGAQFTAGVVVPSTTYYYPAVIRGAEAAAGSLGIQLVLGVSQYDQAEERKQVEQLVQAGVDGLLVATTRSPDDDAALAELLSHQPVPVVLIERSLTWPPVGPGIEYVRTDHEHGAVLGMTHLAAQGHRRIGLATLAGTPTTPWLVSGHAEGVRRLNLHSDAPAVELPRAATALQSGALGELLAACISTGTTALLVHPDEDAIRLAQFAITSGLRVPDDLALVAYDDEVAGLGNPPLTAVAPPKEDVGRTAVELLGRRLVARQDRALRHISLLPSLRVRASCGLGTAGT